MPDQKPGQGFARLVTTSTLSEYASLLRKSDPSRERDARASARARQDPRVQAAEKLFQGRPIKGRRRLRASPRVSHGRKAARRAGRTATSREVLIAEIPAGGSRWNQANFRKQDFDEFFRLGKSGGQLRLLHVSESSNTPATAESRPKVAVKSRNFRIELHAAAGLPYPTTGRPIGAFVHTPSRAFAYMLLMPGSAGHKRADAILAKHATPRAKQLRRARLPMQTAQREWPKSRLWKYVGPHGASAATK
jgi:hypothetical protein